MDEAKEIQISRTVWSADIETMLAPACPVMPEVRAQVQSGRAQVFEGMCNGKRLIAFVLRVDELASGSQGVVVAAAGDGDDINLTDVVLPVMERMFISCNSVRIHTRRRGLAQKLMQRGYAFEEIVLMKDLT